MEIKNLTSDDIQRWDDFVESCQDATFFHKAGWKEVIERTFKHQAHFLYAEENGEIKGVLPLVNVNSWLFGNTLSSTPFCVYGGVATVDSHAGALLRDAACNLAESLGVDALELRNIQSSDSGWPSKDLYVTFRKEIDPDPEVNLKAIPRKQRAMVRKGIKSGLIGEFNSDPVRLYKIYSESVRNLGTPVFSAKYLSTLKDVFGEQCDVMMVTHEGQDVAGVMSFYFKDEVLPYYGGSITQARSLKANDFMYWELMRDAAERGIKIFDYGRSKQGTGSYSFKKNWGFIPQPLHYEYHLVKSKSIPEVNPTNPKYQLFIKAWKKLPLPVANTIGPFLARNLG
ncbi:MAG: FemAB family XrtA/PEP-CTERM system-associated protein [Sedimenticola sp.]